MKIHYHQNPLRSVVELDAHDLEKLRLKLIIKELEERVYEAFFCLESGDRFDPEAARRELDVASLEDEPLNKYLDEQVEFYVGALRGWHIGDCTCVPASCFKCYAESLLGIDTIAGLNKHQATHLEDAFADDRTIDEAIAWLTGHVPVRRGAWLSYPAEEFERCVPRWMKEAQQAAEWLRAYREKLNEESAT